MTVERQRLYWVWEGMKRRCRDPKSPDFMNYGGRGIVVSLRWQQSFDAFVEDMGPRPDGGLLDRINNNGHYTRENCKWSTRNEQNSNRRNCIYVDVDGGRMTLKAACCRAGLKYQTIHKRIAVRGWDVARALSTPIAKGQHACE